jgi:hypothetical protein
MTHKHSNLRLLVLLLLLLAPTTYSTYVSALQA